MFPPWQRGTSDCADTYRKILDETTATHRGQAAGNGSGYFSMLLDALRDQPKDEQAALALVAIEGLTIAEAGSVLERDPDGVRLEANRARDAVLAAASSQGARILIAEDERIAAFELREMLRRMGHTPIGVAATVDEALARAVRDGPDLALVDVRLKGGGDGIGCLQGMRQLAGVPGIVITAFGDQRARAEGPAAAENGVQAYGFLVKPWGEADLRQAVSDVLLRIAAERAAEATLSPAE